MVSVSGGCVEIAYDSETDLTAVAGESICDGARIWIGNIEPQVLQEFQFLEIDAAAEVKVHWFVMGRYSFL